MSRRARWDLDGVPEGVPLTTNGSILHYLDFGCYKIEAVEPFDATLAFTGTQRGRSSAYFVMTEVNAHGEVWATGERMFPMFMSEVLRMLPQVVVANGRVPGRWEAMKRGENFGIRWVGHMTRVPRG